ncbi:MAG: hypothetical protein KDK27_16955 [Leptospiraceae bacterium]|nr:hypothetical protein [Leptospiraceae bacterium]
MAIHCRSGDAPIVGPEQAGAQPGEFELELNVSDRTRRAYFYLPDQVSRGTDLPLVFVLHGGGGGRVDTYDDSTGWRAKGAAEGAIIVYPYGTGRLSDYRLLTWNAGNCCGYAFENNVDDVQFFRELIRFATDRLPVDAKRIYATGISNGGMMSHRLACELSDKIAAIGPVVGAQNMPECHPDHPVSVIAIRGMQDGHVAYYGGPTVGADQNHRYDRPAEYTLQFWKTANGCAGDVQKSEAGNVIREVYADCRDGSAVELISLKNGKHAWPGGKKGWAFGDEPTQDISATDEIWSFFEKHAR